MTVWFVVAVPLLIMFFALAMERLESRLRRVAAPDNEIEEVLQAARADEMRALFGNGIISVLSLGREGLGRSRRARQRS
jgi:ribosomal protein L19E